MTMPRVSATMLSANNTSRGDAGMLDMIPREARRLGVEERRRLIDLLRAQVFAELGRSGDADREPDACPRCGGTHLVRKGHDRDGSQRWARGSCGRTLSRKTMGLLGYPEPEEDVWASYVGHACAGGTPGECARACGVCPGTSWLVRTGLCEVMGRALAPFRSGPTVSCQVDGTYLDESLAGRRSRSRAVLPRGPRRSAATCASAAYRTPRCACSAGGATSATSSASSRTGAGRPTRRSGRPCGPWARARPSRPTASRGTPGCCRGSACRATTRRPRARSGTASSAWRCAMHARPEGFLARLGGISTRRLGHYLDWFLWDEQTRRSDADRADTLSGQAATGGYDHTRVALAREPQPFWSYWEERLAMSTVV